MFLKFSDGGQAVYGISRKTADGFCDDEVYLPGKGIVDPAFETSRFFGIESGYSFVRIHSGKLPFGI